MRYGLRTLLIVIAVVALILARQTHLWRQAEFHRREAAKVMERICLADGATSVNYYLRMLALFQEQTEQDLREGTEVTLRTKKTYRFIAVGEGEDGRYIRSPQAKLSDWRVALYHARAAKAYDRAFWRPWQIVTAKPAPKP